MAVSNGKNQKDFLDIVKNWSELDEIARDPGADQLYYCLKEFFELLGRKTGSDDPAEICDDFRKMIKSEGQRLHIGSTFTELCEILRKIWHTPGTYTEADWYARISRTLDQQIDQGFIVPAIGLSGSRIFRKGEASPYDTVSMNILKCLGISATPENLDANVAALSGENEGFLK